MNASRPSDFPGSVASHCSTSFNFDGMLNKMRELRAEMEKQPNGFVMTIQTLAKVKSASDVQDSQFASGAIGAFMGVPIEDYATAKECLDRMMNQREGERLQLVMPPKDIPVECISHPWLKRQANAMARQCGFRIAKDTAS